MASEKQKVLIIGGGFGGVKAALELADHPHFSVTLISDQENFRYYPTLYHAATGGSALASSIPLSEIFAGKDLKIVKDSAKKIDRDSKKVKCASGKSYSYDTLIVALGVITNYFGIKGLKEYSYGIKTLEDAQELRDHLHEIMLDEHKPDLNYVVIGGGPTGVELAGALPSYLKHIMKRHKLAKKTIHVDLVEATPRLTSRMPKHYSIALQKRLRRIGVKLYLNQKVEAETAEGLMVSGHNIASHTVVWTAGVTNHPFLSANEFNMSEHGKAVVNELLQAEENIYVIGDNAETTYSGMAQTALHDALFVANNLKRLSSGKQPWPYKPRKPVYVTPAGSHWAAVQWGNVHIYGWMGWILRNVADLVAYHDLEPWWPASKHWVAENLSEETCPVCTTK
ncbi:MAG TPA: FAD-dependent oxidoreductase [Candidatus Saccharimonadales bacterium]|nr:FAD-dependent oxidoreductase [Candidatus Saccharimonadales bacterium]